MTVPLPAASASVADATLAGEAGTSRKRGGLRRRDRIVGLFAVAPAFLVVVGFMAFPVMFALYISFTKTNGLTFQWRGLDNYVALVGDPVVHQVFLNNLKFLISVPLVIFVALIVSVLLFEQYPRLAFLPCSLFLPNVLSVAVIGIMFRNAFGYYGAVNQAIGLFGGEPSPVLHRRHPPGDRHHHPGPRRSGSATSPCCLRGAHLDQPRGVRGRRDRRRWLVEAPLVHHAAQHPQSARLPSSSSTCSTRSPRSSGSIFVMTAGGPGFETTTIDYLVYLRAFSSSNLGSGAALAVVLFLFIGVLTVIQNRAFRLGDDD